jgi:hypothetical protein
VTGYKVRILEVIAERFDSVKVREINMLGNKRKIFLSISADFASNVVNSKNRMCIDEKSLKIDSILSADLNVSDINNNKLAVINSKIASSYSHSRFYENNIQLGYCASLEDFVVLFNSCVNGTSDFYPGIFKDWILGFDLGQTPLSKGVPYILLFKTNFNSGRSIISKIKFTFN